MPTPTFGTERKEAVEEQGSEGEGESLEEAMVVAEEQGVEEGLVEKGEGRAGI